MKPLKQKVSITLDEDLIIKLKEMAEESDRSFSQYINLVLKKYISQKEKGKPEE
ncbi:MAG: ribbon-helix-helix protein, CopG family [Clostridia bacterium]|nr:ribbon-helix-helix protein, CopG family [Clostridia bacterium]